MKYILVSLLFVDIEGVVFIMLNGAKFLAHTPLIFNVFFFFMCRMAPVTY